MLEESRVPGKCGRRSELIFWRAEYAKRKREIKYCCVREQLSRSGIHLKNQAKEFGLKEKCGKGKGKKYFWRDPITKESFE